MAVNKNFVVKNGLEVASDVILADATTKNVGLGSTAPQFTLDVRGGIGATDIKATGFTTATQGLQVGTSGSVFYVSDSTNNVGVGTSVPNPIYTLDVRSSVSTGQTALYVFGDMRVTGDINLDDINASQINISGLSTFVGFSTFNDYVFVQDGFNVTGAGITATTVNISGVSTFTGAIDANGSLDVDGHTELDDVNVSGASTFAGAIDANGSLDVDGHTELDDVNVSGMTTLTDLNVTGVITATSFVGSGQIGVGSGGSFIGAGATMIDFKTSGATNTVDLSAGIATVTVTSSGVSLGLAIALGG
jgi:hypothetical protein